MLQSVMNSSLPLAPELIDPASKDRGEAESLAPMWEVISGIEGLVEEWERVERSLIRGPWGPEF